MFGGDITISSGATLNMGNRTSNGTIVTITNFGVNTYELVNNGSLIFNNPGDVANFAYIVGSGTLTKEGTNRLRLSQEQHYTGATFINAGTLELNSVGNSSAYHIASGATLLLNSVFNPNHGSTTFSGAGILRKGGSGSTRWGSSSATFALASGAMIDVQNGTFIGGSNANEDWTQNESDLNVGTFGTFDGVEANIRVDALTGSGTILSGYNGAGYQAFTFGVDNGSGTFSGLLADSNAPGRFVKNGTGTQALLGTGAYTGGTVVEQGTLVADGDFSAATGEMIVHLDATLAGSGTIGGDTTISGTLSGNLTFGGDLTLVSTALTTLEISSELTFDRIDVEGVLTYGGTLEILFTEGYQPLYGSAFDLFDPGGGYVSVFSEIKFFDSPYTGSIDYSTGVLTIVPEPSVLSLLAAAGGFAALRRRRGSAWACVRG